MSMQDPIADMLTRIRNALMSKHQEVSIPSSKAKVSIVDVLKSEGYILDYKVEANEAKKNLIVSLKYEDAARNMPVIRSIKRVSKPSLRVYKTKDELPSVLNGLGVAIISTPAGMVSDKKARELGQGGEVICFVE